MDYERIGERMYAGDFVKYIGKCRQFVEPRKAAEADAALFSLAQILPQRQRQLPKLQTQSLFWTSEHQTMKK